MRTVIADTIPISLDDRGNALGILPLLGAGAREANQGCPLVMPGAHLLCEFGVRLEAAGLGTKLAYQLPMAQEHLADCTGLSPVHVNRTLKGLEASGDITRSVRELAVANWEKISRTADFEEDYLHLRWQPKAPELPKAAPLTFDAQIVSYIG